MSGPGVTFFLALFAIMNPIGNVGVFVGLVGDRPRAEARRIAWSCAMASAVTGLIVMWFGDLLLKLFGISIDALRVSGGLIVLLIGLAMLRNDDQHRHTSAERDHGREKQSPAIVPLAIPIVAGPGTMATILVAAHHHSSMADRLIMSVVLCLMCVLVGLAFSLSQPIAARLGASGIALMTRIMGLLLATIATTMLAQGLSGLFPLLARP